MPRSKEEWIRLAKAREAIEPQLRQVRALEDISNEIVWLREAIEALPTELAKVLPSEVLSAKLGTLKEGRPG